MELSYLAEDRYVWAQFTGPWTVDGLCKSGASLLAECVLRNQSLLLIDLSKLPPAPLSTYDRFRLGTSTLIFNQKLRKVAVLAYSGMIDPERFGETVAQNRGVPIQVFDEPGAAQRWLMAGP
jgi:hypothetical protein